MFVEGLHCLRAQSIYNGRTLWEVPLPVCSLRITVNIVSEPLGQAVTIALPATDYMCTMDSNACAWTFEAVVRWPRLKRHGVLTVRKESGDTLPVMATFFSDLWSTRTTW